VQDHELTSARDVEARKDVLGKARPLGERASAGAAASAHGKLLAGQMDVAFDTMEVVRITSGRAERPQFSLFRAPEGKADANESSPSASFTLIAAT
jgi:hypothetical protein